MKRNGKVKRIRWKAKEELRKCKEKEVEKVKGNRKQRERKLGRSKRK